MSDLLAQAFFCLFVFFLIMECPVIFGGCLFLLLFFFVVVIREYPVGTFFEIRVCPVSTVMSSYTLSLELPF